MNLSSLLRRWRALIHKQELDNELDDEMRFHLERDIEENIRNGMSPEEARFAAMRTFGAMDQSKEECRDARGVGNKTAAKLSDGRERVYLAAAVLNDRRTTDVEMHLAWLVAPLVRVLSLREFRDKLVKRCMTVADARAVAQHSVETGWFTIVVHADLLIALNGACADCQAQQSNSRKRRKYNGAEAKP